MKRKLVLKSGQLISKQISFATCRKSWVGSCNSGQSEVGSIPIKFSATATVAQGYNHGLFSVCDIWLIYLTRSCNIKNSLLKKKYKLGSFHLKDTPVCHLFNINSPEMTALFINTFVGLYCPFRIARIVSVLRQWNILDVKASLI